MPTARSPRDEARRTIIKAFTDGVGREPAEYVTTRFPFALYRRIESFAGDKGVNRSEAVRRLIERGLAS